MVPKQCLWYWSKCCTNVEETHRGAEKAWPDDADLVGRRKEQHLQWSCWLRADERRYAHSQQVIIIIIITLKGLCSFTVLASSYSSYLTV